jgi:hypothetical protein
MRIHFMRYLPLFGDNSFIIVPIFLLSPIVRSHAKSLAVYNWPTHSSAGNQF